MPKFIFAYHGGKMPETQEEGARVMAAWTKWYEELGPAIADGGAPVTSLRTVSSNGIVEGGGANPLSGYTLVNADNIDVAIEMAKGCPILEHGTVEVAEAMEM